MRHLIFSILAFSSIAIGEVKNIESETQVPALHELEVASPEGSENSKNVPASESLAVDNRKESEIPLNFESKKAAASEDGGVLRIMMTLTILGLVGGGAFFLLRRYSVPRTLKHQTQIKVLQQHYLGPKKSLAIVRVAGESILLGITDHNINMIKSLSLLDEEVPEQTPGNFGRTLQGEIGDADFVDGDSTPVQKQTKAKSSFQIDSDEEFAISGIKDIVSKRLKGMRTF